jgi:multiple sugar transport system substrate-binding protein
MTVSQLKNHLHRLTAVAALICLLVLVGCGGGAVKQEPVTISFAFLEGPDRGHYEALVKKFQQDHPNVTIELRGRRSSALSLLQGTDADAFALDALALGALQQRGSLLVLDALISADRGFNRADFYRGMLELFSRDGKTWAIPAGADLYVMYYNQDLFDKRNLPYPKVGWTWNDFLTDALALTDFSAGVYGYAVAQDSPDVLLFVYQHGGKLVDNLQRPTRVTFTDPKTVEAVEWYARLFGDRGAAATPDEARTAFGGGSNPVAFGIQNGKEGMWMDLLSERGGSPTGPGQWRIKWGMAPPPRGAQQFTGGLVEGYAISAKTAQRDTAWQWISFLSKEMPRRLAPPRRSVATAKAYEEAAGREVAAVVRQAMETAFLISPWTMGEMLGALQLFLQAVNPVINQGVPAQDALEQAQRQAEQLFQ